MEPNTGLFALFALSFLAATILPAQSEMALAVLQNMNRHDPMLLVAVASAGNILGALVNWLLGAYAMTFRNRSWFPVSEKSIDRAGAMYRKWGIWTLLLSWVPVVGDPLTLVAGIFRTRLWIFIPLVSVGKIARYLAVVEIMK